MRDGAGRSLVKGLVRFALGLELRLARRLRAPSGGRYALQGTCNGCGRCCESPMVRVPAVVFAFPFLRWLFLAWQREANGFELAGENPEARTFVFTCSHYGLRTKTCDSYHSRPYICRDYPRVLLESTAPEFFAECGYSAFDKRSAGLASAIAELPLPPKKREELARKLFLKKE